MGVTGAPPDIGVSGGTTHAEKQYFAKRSHLEFGVFGFFGVGSYSAGAQRRIYDLRSGFGLVRRLTPLDPPRHGGFSTYQGGRLLAGRYTKSETALVWQFRRCLATIVT